MKRLSFITAAVLLVSGSAMAAGGMSARSAKTFGLLARMQLPGTSTFGGEVAFQGGLARISAGYLSVAGAGKITGTFNLFVPPWSMSPTVGVRAYYPLATGSSLQLAGEAGLDWQTRVGLNIGGGVTYGLSGMSGLGYYVQLGWFFGKGK
jgi:hypothetical protein